MEYDLEYIRGMESELKHLARLLRCDIFQVAVTLKNKIEHIKKLEEEVAWIKTKLQNEH